MRVVLCERGERATSAWGLQGLQSRRPASMASTGTTVFVNHVDTYVGREISRLLASSVVGRTNAEEEEEEEAGEAGERYRVIGTLSNAQAEKPAWVSEIVSAGDALRDALLGCSSVVYDITSNPSQVAAAVAAVELLAAAAADEVAGGAGGKSRTFVCLSSVLTWAKTKPADPEASAVRCAAFYGLHAACDSYLAWLLFPRAIPCTITRRPNCHAAPNTGTPIAGLPCCA